MPDYVDVLPLLTDAAAALAHGQLVQSSTITLFETNSAIEIGEPRMDGGLTTPEELQQPPFEAHRALFPQELICLMDAVLRSEMAWHQGNSLSQTLYTCMYVHNLDGLLDEAAICQWAADHELLPKEKAGAWIQLFCLLAKVLRTYLRATLKTCDIVMEEMLKGHLYDNEDIVSDKAGVSLLEDVEIDTILDELFQAQYLLERESDATDLLADWTGPLLYRLNLRLDFLCAVTLFAIDHSDLDRHLGHIAGILDAAGQLQSPEIYGNTPESIVSGVINPFFAKKLESLAPPRPPLPPLPLEQAISQLRELVDGMNSVCSLFDAKHWNDIESHFLEVARNPRNPASKLPYIRSLHQTVFYSQGKVCGQYKLAWLADSFFYQITGLTRDDFAEDHIPAMADSLPGATLSARADRLFLQTAGYLVTYIEQLGKNRPKQYRKLAKSLDQWQVLHDTMTRFASSATAQLGKDKADLDCHLLVSAVDSIRDRITLEILTAGFELDLYGSEETYFIYWYISHVAGDLASTFARLRTGFVGKLDLWSVDHQFTEYSGIDDRRLLQLQKRYQVWESMADVTLKMLVQSQPLRKLNKLDKTSFERRFKWALKEGSIAPSWQQFEDDFNLISGKRGPTLLNECEGSLSALVADSSSIDDQAIYATCIQNLGALRQHPARLEMQPESGWRVRIFPLFQ